MDNYLDFTKDIDFEKLKKPAEIIKKGGIVVFPTETVYAIGTNGFDENGIKRLYNVKNRPLDKPISLLVSDFEMIEAVAEEINEIEYKIIKAFFPGPLTIVLKKNKRIPDILTAGLDTIGIRMPDNEIAKALVKLSGGPIAAPSANISGKESGIEAKEILKDFGDNVDYYIDSGKSKIGISSTIVKVVDGKIKILRHGEITEEDINNAINKL